MSPQRAFEGGVGDEEHHDETDEDQGEDDPAKDLDQLRVPRALIVHKTRPLLELAGQLRHWGQEH